MSKNSLLVVTEMLIEEQPKLNLEELCMACDVTPDYIQDLIEYGILDLADVVLEEYEFDTEHLRRVRAVKRLQQDLEINLPGAALVLDLISEIETMRTQLELYERYLLINL